MRKVTFYLYLGLFSILTSCDRILEEKSDRSLATINTPEELQALLDYGVIMHKSYVGAIGDVASDNFLSQTTVTWHIPGRQSGRCMCGIGYPWATCTGHPTNVF